MNRRYTLSLITAALIFCSCQPAADVSETAASLLSETAAATSEAASETTSAAVTTMTEEETTSQSTTVSETESSEDTTSEETTADTDDTVNESSDEPFYGVWTGAFSAQDEDMWNLIEKLRSDGYDPFMVYTPDWENMNPDPYYCITTGRFASKEEADEALTILQEKGHTDAYVKYTGSRISHRYLYYSYSIEDMQVTPEKVTMKHVQVDDLSGEELLYMDLVIDSDTVFADGCEYGTFGNYEDGMTVLEWFNYNNELAQNDPDKYMQNGPALAGLFEVSITDGHIDSFYGSYWWD